MSVVTILRRAAAPAAAGLAASCVLATAAPGLAAPATLHVAATVSLGTVGRGFAFNFSQAPNGTVYYPNGRVVFAVTGSERPAAVLHAGAKVLAVAATSTDFFAEVGRTVSEYKVTGRRFVRRWTLPKSPAPLTSAGLYAVGSTLWAWTDWGTDQSGFEFANVSRISTSSPVVHKVATNTAYPADMAADAAGLYYEATVGGRNVLVRVTPAGRFSRASSNDIDAPLALAAGRVWVLAFHQPADKQFVDAFGGSSLRGIFSRQVSALSNDIAGTGDGLLLLRPGLVSRVSTNTGHVTGSLSVPHAITLVPGPSAVVITVSHNHANLVRLAG